MSQTKTITETSANNVKKNDGVDETGVFWQPPAIDEKLNKSIGDMRMLPLVDISGSTSGSVGRCQHEVLGDLLGVPKATGAGATLASLMDSLSVGTKKQQESDTDVYLWDSRFQRVEKYSRAKVFPAMGGTAPASTIEYVIRQGVHEHNDLFILMTDGEIGPSEVLATSKHAATFAGIPTIIVITHAGRVKASQLNVSVAASFLGSCTDVLLLARATSQDCFRVISTRGVFKVFGEPQVSETTLLAELPTVSAEQIRALVINVGVRPPPGFSRLGAQFVHLAKLLRDSTELPDEATLMSIMEDQSALLMLCKTRNLLPDLRKWVLRARQKLEKEAAEHAKKVVDEVVDTDAAVSEASLVSRLRAMQLAASSDPEALEAMRAKLREMRHNKVREKIVTEKLTRNMARSSVATCNSLLAAITEIEKAGYSADILGRLSNRAMRAKKVDATLDFSKLDTDNAPKGECMVCADENVPLSILLKCVPKDQVELNTNDSACNWPLSQGDQPHNLVLCPDVLCLQCACQMSQSPLTREDVKQVIPVVPMSNTINRDALLNAFSLALSCGLKMGHVPLIFFAIVDHYLHQSSGVADKDHEELRSLLVFLRDELLSKYKTTLILGSTKLMPLKAAMLEAIESDDFNLNYGVPGMCLVYRTLHEVGAGVTDSGATALHVRLLRELVGTFLYRIRNNREDTRQLVKREVTQLIFRTRHGVPVANSAHLVALDDLLAFFNEGFIVQPLRLWAECVGVSLDEFVQTPAFTLVLFHCLTVNNHNRAATLITQWCAEESEIAILLANALADPKNLTDEAVLEYMNKQYRRECEKAHSNTVPFKTIFGPSVLACGSCGHPFAGEKEMTSLSVEKLTEVIRKKRAAHFKAVYHAEESGNPSDNSSHYNAHLAVVSTYKDDKSDEENMEAAIKWIVSHDKRGNIWCAKMEEDLQETLRTYKEARANASAAERELEARLEESKSRCTLLDKVVLELNAKRSE